jgi:hypothetical protein
LPLQQIPATLIYIAFVPAQSISGNHGAFTSYDDLTSAIGELRSCLAYVKSRCPFWGRAQKHHRWRYEMLHSEDPPFLEQDWVAEGGASSGRRMRDQSFRSDQPMGIPRQLSIQSSRSFGAKDPHVASTRPPIRQRMVRTVTRFFVTVLIGVGATLAWQSYGDAAREAMAVRAPALAWLFPVSETKSPVAAPDPAELLAPLATNLELVRRNVEQLAAKQDQMAQNITLLQAVDEDIREKMSSAAPAQQTVAAPQPKPPQQRTQPAAPRALPPGGSVSR